jgi:dynein assembly factor with WDR repeat domains 1
LSKKVSIASTDVDIAKLVEEVISREPLIHDRQRHLVHALLKKLLDKIRGHGSAEGEASQRDFFLFKVLRAHVLPLTNCAFNKSGDRFITGSYDRTCKVFDTDSGNELLNLEGHRNVVYAIAFNNPFGDKIVTASFDRSCKLWDATTGHLYSTYIGHELEIVCIDTNPSDGSSIATGSMDRTARIWDTETGVCLHTLKGHGAEIISLQYDSCGKYMITGSFDNTVRLWDVRHGRCIREFVGHTGEISSARLNFQVSVY